MFRIMGFLVLCVENNNSAVKMEMGNGLGDVSVMITTLVRWAILGVLLPGAAHLGAAFVGDRGGICASATQQHVGIVHMQPGRGSRSRGS